MHFFIHDDFKHLLEKTTEELICLHEEFSKKKEFLEEEKIKLVKVTRDNEKEQKKIDDYIKFIFIEISNRKKIEDEKSMITEDIMSIEGYNILSENELSIIKKQMDRRDYSKYGKYPRWIDLERIISFVINIKKQYPNWILTALSSGCQHGSMPPQTFYNYEFRDEKNIYIDIGEGKLTSSFNNVRHNLQTHQLRPKTLI